MVMDLVTFKSWQEISVLDMARFVHHKVAVSVHDNREFVGWIFTIDPVTQSIVVYLNGQLTTVMGHAISEVTTLEKPTPEIKMLLGSLLEEKQSQGGQWIEQRRSKLTQWLRDNRCPVQLQGDKIIVANALDIVPPYNVDSCRTSNEMILGRIQKLIEMMPR